MRTPDTVLWRAARSPIHSWIQRAVTASRWPELSRFSPASAGWAQCLGYSALCPGLWGWVSRHQRWNAEEVLNAYYIEMSKKKGVSATDSTRTSTGLEPEADGPGPRGRWPRAQSPPPVLQRPARSPPALLWAGRSPQAEQGLRGAPRCMRNCLKCFWVGFRALVRTKATRGKERGVGTGISGVI